MRQTLNNLFLVLGCGVVLLGSARQAEAGLIVTSLESIGLESSGAIEIPDSGASSSASTEDDSKPDPSREYNLPEEALLLSQSSGGSMSSPSSISGSSGSAPASAFSPSTPALTQGQLSYRLSLQREPYHPRFIKSRLFRPPREVEADASV